MVDFVNPSTIGRTASTAGRKAPGAGRSIDRHTKVERTAAQARPGAQKPCSTGKDTRTRVKRTGGGQYNWGDDLQDWQRDNKYNGMTGSLPTEFDERYDPPANDAPLAYAEEPPLPQPHRTPKPMRVGLPPAPPPVPESATTFVAPNTVVKPVPTAGRKKVLDRHTKGEKAASQARPAAHKPCGVGKDLRVKVKRVGGGQYNWGDELRDYDNYGDDDDYDDDDEEEEDYEANYHNQSKFGRTRLDHATEAALADAAAQAAAEEAAQLAEQKQPPTLLEASARQARRAGGRRVGIARGGEAARTAARDSARDAAACWPKLSAGAADNGGGAVETRAAGVPHLTSELFAGDDSFVQQMFAKPPSAPNKAHGAAGGSALANTKGVAGGGGDDTVVSRARLAEFVAADQRRARVREVAMASARRRQALQSSPKQPARGTRSLTHGRKN